MAFVDTTSEPGRPPFSAARLERPFGLQWVDFVVPIASIGDPQGILSGSTRPTTDPVGLQIASNAAKVIDASGLLLVTTRLAASAGPKIDAARAAVPCATGRLARRTCAAACPDPSISSCRKPR